MSKFCVLTTTKEFKATQEKFNLSKFTLELLLYHYYNNVVNSLDTFPSDDYIKELIDPTIITDDKKLKEFRDKNYNQEMIFDSIEDCRKKLEELRDLFNEDLIIVYTNSDEKLVIKIAKFEFKESERSILKRIEEQFEKIRNLKVPVKNKLTDVFDKAWLRDNKQFKNFRHAFDTAKIDKTLRDRIIEGIKLNPDMFDGKTFDLIIEILTSGLTDNLKDIYNKSLEKQVDTALEQHLMNFLKRYNIISKEATPEEIIAELKETYKDRDFEGFGLGAFDVLNKIIYLSNNRNKITAPEEFAHAFVELMGALKNEDFLFLNREVSKTDIYKQVYEQYKDIYVRKDGKPDLLMIRKEAIGLALAAAIVDRWESQNDSEERSKRDKTFFDKLIEWLEKILDLFKGAKRVSFNQLVTSIATDVLDNNHTRLENYGNENFAKQEYQRTLDANPLALKYMQKMSEFGNVMTGSISVRFLGELYREGEDDLHDIDMIVPQSAHGVDLHSFVVRQTALNTRKANPILLEYVKNLDYFKKVLAEFPDMVLAGAYPNNYKRFEYITVNAVMSKDHDLTRRFIQMSGSYADRLKNFTKEEQDLIYLFDFFLKEGEVRTVKDEKNKLNLAHFEESFTAKLIDMGRPKDVFDYQKWKAYKTATKANRGQVFFQSFKPGIEIKPNPMQQVALEEMTDYVHSRINGKQVPSFFLLNGMAGTGKTTIINLLLKQLTDEGLLITTVVGAVANKAKLNIFHKLDKDIIRNAKVKQSSVSGILGLFSSLNENKSGTSYTSLEGKYGSVMKNKRGPSNIIIIDECSMIEDRHFDKLMAMAQDLNFTMIFVGDSGQLPLIEDGSKQSKNDDFNAKKNSEVSKTFLLASDEATVTLTERVRLGEGNPILDASEKFYITQEDAKKMKADGDLNLEDLKTTITDLGAFIAKKKAMFNYDRDVAELFRRAFKERNTSLVKYVCDTNKNVYDMNVKVRKSIFGNNYTVDFKDGDIVMLKDQYIATNSYGQPDTLDNSLEGVVLHHRELRLDEDKYEGYCSSFMLFCKKLNNWVDKNGTNFPLTEEQIDSELMRLWNRFALPMNRPVSPIRKIVTRKLDGTATTSLHNIFEDVYKFSNRLRGKILPVRTIELTLLAQGEHADEPEEYRVYAIHPEDWDKYEENIKNIYLNTGKRDEYTGKYTNIIKGVSAQILHSYYGGRKTPSKSWMNFFGAQLVDSYKNSRARLQYGYAITSHKSQGSTYDVTIIDGDAIAKANWGLADKSRMMYTAITRSSNITMVITDLTYDNTETEPLDKLNDRINKNRGNSKVDVPNDTYVPEPAERPSLRSSTKTVLERTKTVKLDGKDIDITYLEVNQPSDKLPEILNGKITLYNNTKNDIINQLFSDSNYTSILTTLSQMGFTKLYIQNLLDSDDAANDLLLIKQYIETIYDVEQQQENIDAVRERALRDALIYVARLYDKTLPLLTPMARTIHKLTTITAFNKQHITFDEKNHKYYYDGKPNNYSVTEFVEALKLNFDEDKIKAEKKKRATSKPVNGGAAIGNVADKQLRAMFAGTFRAEDFNDNPRITKEVKNVYKQIKEKLDQMFPDGYYVETNEDALRLFASILVSDGRGNYNERFIAGTMDMLVVDAKGDTYIFDFKTHKANYEDEITDDFGTKSRYNAQTSWYSAMMEAVNGITAKDRNLLQINYLSDLSGNEPYDITVSLNDDNYVIQKVNLSNGSYTTFNGPTDIHFYDVVHTPEVPTTSTLIPAIKGMPNSITSLAQAQRKSPANLFDLIAARERQVNQQNINPLATIVPESPAIGENISSKGSEFAKKLTNPGNNISIEFRGRTFKNAEHAYQTWKSGEFDEVAYNNGDQFKPKGSKPVNKDISFDLMVEILTAKLQQHPDLVLGINDRGGLQYLLNSTHNVVGDEYWEKQGKFIEALQKAYQNVSSSLQIGTEDYDKQTKDGSTTLKARKFYIKGREDAGYFEITTTNTSNVYSVHFKTTSKDALNEDEKQALFSKLAKSFPEGAIVSTYGEISRGGIAGLNRFKNLGFTQVSVRTIRHKEGGYTTIPVFVKNTLGKTLPTIMPAGTQFTRDSVENDTKSLYIFTDNTDRDSGSKLIEPDSWYAQTYGQGHHYPTKTSAVLRGLDNARPISTLHWYNSEKKGKTGRWTDADFEEFKQVVDKEFDDIFKAWRSGKYDRIILPSDSGLKDGLINGDISNITYERTPKLFDYLHDKMDQLVKNIITQQISTVGTVKYIQSKGGYGQRTDENAEWSDITVAVAADFTTAGESRTRRAAEPEGKYVAEDISHYKNLNASDGQYFAHRLVETLNIRLLIEKHPDGIKLNIAGNGIYTLSEYGITLEQVDSYMDGFIFGLLQKGVKIKEIRSGGQTGLDEAGIKAGLVYGIPVSINAPKDYAFRDIDGIDIRDEQQFKARFDNYSRPDRYNTATPTEPAQPFTPINDKYANPQQQLEENLIDYSQLNNPFVVQRSTVNSIDSIANGEYTISFDVAINDNNNAKLDTEQKQKETLKMFLDLTVSNLPIGARITVDTGDDLQDIELWGILNRHRRLFVDTSDPTDIEINQTLREDAALINAAKKAGLMSKGVRLTSKVTLYPFTYARSYNEMKWSQQYSELNAKVPGKRLKALAVSAVYKISELVTMIQEGGNEDLFPTEYREKVRKLKGANRATILSSQDGIGIIGLANVVKEAFFNVNAPEEIRNTHLDKLNRKKTKEIVAIYENFESFIRFGYAKLQALEGITVNETAVTDPRTIELFDGEEEMNIQEIYGSSLEHWQVGFRSVSATMSLSQMIKEALNKFYELDENDDIIYDEYGFEKRINSTLAVSTMLSWFIGTESVEDMIEKLKEKSEEHRWLLLLINDDPDLLDTTGRPIGLGLLITEDKDGNHIPQNEEFRSKFFNNMHLYFTKYGIIKKNGDIAIVNDKNVISAIANDALVITENNPDNFKDGVFVGKAKEGEEPTVVDKIIALRIAINLKAKNKKNLLVDDELAEMIEDLFGLLGITQFTTDLIKTIIGANPNHLDKIILATSPAKGIANLFLSYNRDNKEIDANFRKHYTKEIQNIVKPFQDFILDRAEAVTYQDGKLYYSYVLPSYLSEFNTKMKNSKEFVENEFRSEFFGLMKNGKKQWLNEWQKKLAENEQARKDFDHKVVLAANGKSYTKKTPKEYATSMINEYFYDKTKRLAWYRIPMMSNKPSEEYIRFTRYTTGYKDTIRNLLVNTAMQEIIRIADVIDRALRIEMGLLAPEDKIKFYDINVDYIKNAEDRHSKKELLKLGIKQGAGTRFVMLDYLQPFLDEALKDRKSGDRQYTGLGKQLMDIILGESVVGMKTPSDMFQGTTLNLLKRAIDYGMDRHFAEFLSVMEAEGVITRKDNGAYTTEIGKLGNTDKLIRENLEEFFWNDTYASLSIMLLYITDPIYYGNAEELQKRLAQLHAPGSRLNITAQDKDGNRYSDGVYRTIKVKDDKVISEIIDKVGKVFDKLIDENRNNAGHMAYYRLLKEFIISELKKVNVTDAQTFCTPTAMRKKLGMLGEWNDAREEAYLRLASGRATKSDYDILMLPLKPFLFGQQLAQDNNGLIKTRRVGILVKTSEYLLVMADAITRSEDGEPTKLRAIFDVIEESLTDKANGKLIPNGRGIDAISFESSIKTGLKAAINLNNLSNDEVKTTLRKAIYAGSDGTNKTSLYNSTFVDELDFRDYSIQQAVPTHFFGTQQLGSQSKALLFADIEEYEKDENGAYKLDNKGNKIPRTIFIKDELGRIVETTVTEAKKEYFDLLAKSIEESCKKLVKELNLDTADVRLLNIAISRLLKKQILDDARFGSDLLWAVDINNNGDFNLPLSDPTHSTRIQQLLFSIIKDRVYKQKIHGGPVVQVSNWGNEALHIRYTNKDGETLLTEEEFNDAKNRLISTRNQEMSDIEKRSIIASVRNKLNKFAPTTVEGKSLNTYQEYVDYHMPGGGVYYECFAPIYDKRLLDYEDENGNIDIEAIRREEPQLLELIGYRIPTEAKYSMASLRIVGFLPREAGEGIMLPKEWTAISGSDFDVDKLYIMRRSFERIINKDKNMWEKGRTETNRINDRVFDIMLGVLESNQAQSKVVKIGTFDPLKIVGYKLAALREQVLQAKLNAEDKNNIDYDALAISYDDLPDSIDDLKDQAIKGKNLAYNHIHLQFFKLNMVAGKLIGVFAQSNISHAYLSMYAISQGLDNGIKINKLKFRDFKLFGHNVGVSNFYIDPIYGFDGTPISDNIAAFLAASVDAVKDPILNLMNINMKTVNSAMILARMGFNIEQIGLLFGLDIVTKVIQRMDQLDETFETAIQNELDILKEAIGKDPELLDVKFSLDLDDRDLKANLVKPTLLIDYTVLSMLQQIHSVAEQTRSIVHMTRFNSISSAKGPDIMNSIIERYKTNNFWLGLGADENEILRDAINNAILAVTRQRSNYFEDVIFGDRFILAKPHFESAFKAYIGLTGLDINNIRKKEAAKFANFYVDYMINKVYNLFDFSYENRLKVMSEYPREILAKKSDERWLDNKFVQSIQQRQDEKDKYVGIDINLRNLEFDDIEDVKADFDEFADEDPETLMKIIEYMFNRGGFGFSPKTFTSLITNYIKEKYMGKYLDNIRLLEMAEDQDASLVDELGNPILFDENGNDDVVDIVYQFLLHQDRKFPKFTINKAKTIELRLGQTTKSLQVGDTFIIRQKLEFGIYRLKMPNTEGTGSVIKLVKVDKIEDTIPAVTYVTVVERLGGNGLGIELNTRKDGIKTIYNKEESNNKEDEIPPTSYPDDPGPGFNNITEEEVDSADNNDANWDSLMDSIELESVRNPRGRLSTSSEYINMKNNPLAGDNNYLAELLRANQSQPVALAMLDDNSDIEAQLMKAASREKETGQTSVNPTIQLAKADLKALGLTDEQLANSDKNYDEKYQCD